MLTPTQEQLRSLNQEQTSSKKNTLAIINITASSEPSGLLREISTKQESLTELLNDLESARFDWMPHNQTVCFLRKKGQADILITKRNGFNIAGDISFSNTNLYAVDAKLEKDTFNNKILYYRKTKVIGSQDRQQLKSDSWLYSPEAVENIRKLQREISQEEAREQERIAEVQKQSTELAELLETQGLPEELMDLLSRNKELEYTGTAFTVTTESESFQIRAQEESNVSCTQQLDGTPVTLRKIAIYKTEYSRLDGRQYYNSPKVTLDVKTVGWEGCTLITGDTQNAPQLSPDFKSIHVPTRVVSKNIQLSVPVDHYKMKLEGERRKYVYTVAIARSPIGEVEASKILFSPFDTNGNTNEALLAVLSPEEKKEFGEHRRQAAEMLLKQQFVKPFGQQESLQTPEIEPQIAQIVLTNAPVKTGDSFPSKNGLYPECQLSITGLEPAEEGETTPHWPTTLRYIHRLTDLPKILNALLEQVEKPYTEIDDVVGFLETELGDMPEFQEMKQVLQYARQLRNALLEFNSEHVREAQNLCAIPLDVHVPSELIQGYAILERSKTGGQQVLREPSTFDHFSPQTKAQRLHYTQADITNTSANLKELPQPILYAVMHASDLARLTPELRTKITAFAAEIPSATIIQKSEQVQYQPLAEANVQQPRIELSDNPSEALVKVRKLAEEYLNGFPQFVSKDAGFQESALNLLPLLLAADSSTRVSEKYSTIKTAPFKDREGEWDLGSTDSFLSFTLESPFLDSPVKLTLVNKDISFASDSDPSTSLIDKQQPEDNPIHIEVRDAAKTRAKLLATIGTALLEMSKSGRVGSYQEKNISAQQAQKLRELAEHLIAIKQKAFVAFYIPELPKIEYYNQLTREVSLLQWYNKQSGINDEEVADTLRWIPKTVRNHEEAVGKAKSILLQKRKLIEQGWRTKVSGREYTTSSTGEFFEVFDANGNIVEPSKVKGEKYKTNRDKYYTDVSPECVDVSFSLTRKEVSVDIQSERGHLSGEQMLAIAKYMHSQGSRLGDEGLKTHFNLASPEELLAVWKPYMQRAPQGKPWILSIHTTKETNALNTRHTLGSNAGSHQEPPFVDFTRLITPEQEQVVEKDPWGEPADSLEPIKATKASEKPKSVARLESVQKLMEKGTSVDLLIEKIQTSTDEGTRKQAALALTGFYGAGLEALLELEKTLISSGKKPKDATERCFTSEKGMSSLISYLGNTEIDAANLGRVDLLEINKHLKNEVSAWRYALRLQIDQQAKQYAQTDLEFAELRKFLRAHFFEHLGQAQTNESLDQVIEGHIQKSVAKLLKSELVTGIIDEDDVELREQLTQALQEQLNKKPFISDAQATRLIEEELGKLVG